MEGKLDLDHTGWGGGGAHQVFQDISLLCFAAEVTVFQVFLNWNIEGNTTGNEDVPKFHMLLHAKTNPSNKNLGLRKRNC